MWRVVEQVRGEVRRLLGGSQSLEQVGIGRWSIEGEQSTFENCFRGVVGLGRSGNVRRACLVGDLEVGSPSVEGNGTAGSERRLEDQDRLVLEEKNRVGQRLVGVVELLQLLEGQRQAEGECVDPEAEGRDLEFEKHRLFAGGLREMQE